VSAFIPESRGHTDRSGTGGIEPIHAARRQPFADAPASAGADDEKGFDPALRIPDGTSAESVGMPVAGATGIHSNQPAFRPDFEPYPALFKSARVAMINNIKQKDVFSMEGMCRF
jgi:hypothetical protein